MKSQKGQQMEWMTSKLCFRQVLRQEMWNSETESINLLIASSIVRSEQSTRKVQENLTTTAPLGLRLLWTQKKVTVSSMNGKRCPQ